MFLFLAATFANAHPETDFHPWPDWLVPQVVNCINESKVSTAHAQTAVDYWIDMGYDIESFVDRDWET